MSEARQNDISLIFAILRSAAQYFFQAELNIGLRNLHEKYKCDALTLPKRRTRCCDINKSLSKSQLVFDFILP